jgi:hypothetical protein
MTPKYKKGDTTEDGWEIMEVNIKVVYTKRRRIVVNDTIKDYNSEFIGKKGWLYNYEHNSRYILDDYPNGHFLFNYTEVDYI